MYAPDARPKKALKRRKNHPKSRSATRWTTSRDASRGFSRREASAGLSVSELIAEMTVEKAIVKRELAIELAGQAADERRRHEHRAQHQRDRDDRPGHFLHGATGRLDRA